MLGLALAAMTASACPVVGETPMIEAELFFGRDLQGHGIVSEAQWRDFADAVLAKSFPDGFTVADGNGFWRDRKGVAVHESSKVVIVITANGPALTSKLHGAMNAYRTRFHQQSVGLATREVCAAF